MYRWMADCFVLVAHNHVTVRIDFKFEIDSRLTCKKKCIILHALEHTFRVLANGDIDVEHSKYEKLMCHDIQFIRMMICASSYVV